MRTAGCRAWRAVVLRKRFPMLGSRLVDGVSTLQQMGLQARPTLVYAEDQPYR